MLQTIKEEFLNELNNQSALSGSYYGVADVARIINLFTLRVAAIEQPARATVDDVLITRLVEIAERWAISHAENCANNYCFDNVDYDINDYRGELTVTASVNVDSNSLARSATFDTTGVKVALKELLTPNTQPNA